jgi:hypothetical protein
MLDKNYSEINEYLLNLGAVWFYSWNARSRYERKGSKDYGNGLHKNVAQYT